MGERKTVSGEWKSNSDTLFTPINVITSRAFIGVNPKVWTKNFGGYFMRKRCWHILTLYEGAPSHLQEYLVAIEEV